MKARETDNLGQCLIISKCCIENPYRPKSEKFILNDRYLSKENTPLNGLGKK